MLTEIDNTVELCLLEADIKSLIRRRVSFVPIHDIYEIKDAEFTESIYSDSRFWEDCEC